MAGTAASAQQAAQKAVDFYQQLQCKDGHWAGDYGGPMFLMPGLIITCYVSGKMETILPLPTRQAMIAYLLNHQQVDGGWGTHIESASTMFGTVLSYVSLRLLSKGIEQKADFSAALEKARGFIHKEGGATYTSSWAKFWLAVLGVYEWDGVNSVPAEMWLLPRWFPFHPGRLWCHCRMVYLPMCYIYGKRWRADVSADPVLLGLRSELYVEKYDTINWTNTRHLVSPLDNYSPIHPLMTTLHNVLVYYERALPKIPFLKQAREKALLYAMNYMRAEDEQTNFIDIGPVNKAMNMLCMFVDEGADSDNFQRHVARVPDYLWVAEDGVKMQGYNGSQCWDTSFAIQAIVSTGHVPQACATKVWRFLERTQILSTPTSQATKAFEYEAPALRERYYRHLSKGGWPFSTSAHGWPISDCTAEGLKAVLELRKLPFIQADEVKISDQRLYDAVAVLLSYQNKDGGWATYENNRGYGWYELLNPSEAFGDIMIDYSYVECSCASLGALVAFARDFPNHRADEIKNAVTRGRNFLKSIQRDDGSWYGSWAVCFTYATWFGIEGLRLCGEDPSSPSIQKAVQFLIGKQNANGGWGEDFTSSFDKAYAENGTGEGQGVGGSGIVQSAWALLALISANSPDERAKTAIDRGIRFLMDRQTPEGDWPQEGITGVFNRACGITYSAYRNIMPIWALGKYISPRH